MSKTRPDSNKSFIDKIEELRKPFPEKRVKWKVLKTSSDDSRGLMAPYIDARNVMRRLDYTVGPENWQREHSYGPDGQVLCTLSIRNDDGEWIRKTDGADATHIEATKGGLSDALKRAAVSWGIGRYLYQYDEDPWVDLDEYSKPKRTPELPEYLLPDGSDDGESSGKDGSGGNGRKAKEKSSKGSSDGGGNGSGDSEVRNTLRKEIKQRKENWEEKPPVEKKVNRLKKFWMKNIDDTGEGFREFVTDVMGRDIENVGEQMTDAEVSGFIYVLHEQPDGMKNYAKTFV